MPRRQAHRNDAQGPAYAARGADRIFRRRHIQRLANRHLEPVHADAARAPAAAPSSSDDETPEDGEISVLQARRRRGDTHDDVVLWVEDNAELVREIIECASSDVGLPQNPSESIPLSTDLYSLKDTEVPISSYY